MCPVLKMREFILPFMVMCLPGSQTAAVSWLLAWSAAGWVQSEKGSWQPTGTQEWHFHVGHRL